MIVRLIVLCLAIAAAAIAGWAVVTVNAPEPLAPPRKPAWPTTTLSPLPPPLARPNV